MFAIPLSQARGIAVACPACHSTAEAPLDVGVNPRGLEPNALWQMDVTDYRPFGLWCNLHVTVDTCTGVIYTTAQMGQKALYVVQHIHQAFQTLGILR